MFLSWFVCALLVAPFEARAAEEKPTFRPTGFLDFNVYPYDTREFRVFTINAFVKLPAHFQYFSLTNFTDDPNDLDDVYWDLSLFFTEQHLRWSLPGVPYLLLTQQLVLRSGGQRRGNDLLRYGFRWNVHETPVLAEFFERMRFQCSVNPQPLSFDHISGFQWQIEYTYRLDLIPDRVYVSAFADQNMGAGPDSWVTEHQIGIRLYDQWHAVAEYRLNDTLSRSNGVGFGVEYIVKF